MGLEASGTMRCVDCKSVCTAEDLFIIDDQPVLSNCMRRSVKLAISVGGRSFKPDAPRTYLKADILKFGVIDKALIALCFFGWFLW